jgi:hypothetical protein
MGTKVKGDVALLETHRKADSRNVISGSGGREGFTRASEATGEA